MEETIEIYKIVHSEKIKIGNIKRNRITDRVATSIIKIFTGITVVVFALFLANVLYNGIKVFSPEILSFTEKGIGNQLFNTIYLLVLSLFVSVPIGIFSGIYMSEYVTSGKISSILKMAVETLSSLPSIVVGLFGYFAFVTYIGTQWNLLSGALTVSIFTIPLITATTYDACKEVPDNYKQGSFALGATRFETIRKVILPAASTRIMTGVILASGRVFGEAAALLYTAGMSTDFSWKVWNIASSQCPLNPLRPGETLALQVWASRMDGIGSGAYDTASAASAILVIMTIVFCLSANYISKYFSRKSEGSK